MTVRRLLSVLSLLLAGVLAAPAPAGAGPRTDAEFVRLVNNTRADQGLRPLRVSARLSGLARRHSVAMARRGRLYHELGVVSRSIRGESWIGQNVGVGRSARSLHHAFVRSRKGHREILLSRRAEWVGVGTVWRPGGRLWVTVNFLQTA
jgi:uncharacterized protein YkwD